MNKIRLDQLLVDRELVETRSRAAALILAGKVYVKDQKVDKAGFKVAEDAPVEIRGESLRYVSRGGLKLEAALDAFGYDCTGKVVIDVGASTGGFTDCVLQRGAAEVWAVDVGYGQLAWRLRQDARVHNIERANIRHLAADAIPTPCALAVIDCSFISLDKVLPNTLSFLAPDADVIALIKPQFEVGQEHVGKGGVVRDMAARTRAIEAVVANACALGMVRRAGIDCPVHGPAGNIEYLVWLTRLPAAPDQGA
jgi:23S rRNA (cytidine1920-2'-O)/16S rRNA (cytidine1409-2'-O)-methyltransferase